MRIHPRLLIAPLLAAALACGGSGGSPTDPGNGSGGGSGSGSGGGYGDPGKTCTPGAGTVCMTSANTFDPSQITIQRGAAVTWNNSTGVTHSIVFTTQGSPSNIGNFASGTRSATFPNPGTYAYYCGVHGLSMSGTVVVQ